MVTRRPSAAQAAEQVARLHTAIDRICDAWELAVEDAASRGWPSSSPGYGERGYLRRVRIDEHGNALPPDPDDVTPPASDTTGDAACRPDPASEWLRRAGYLVGQLISLTPAEAPGENRWFTVNDPARHLDVPALRQTAKRAAVDLVELWPIGASSLIGRVVGAGNEAARRWSQLHEGDTVTVDYAWQGDTVIKVGGRYIEVAECAECRHPIESGHTRRKIDGRQYHERPCWETVRKRRRRQLQKVK